MALLPTGSNKILEVCAADIHVVIKSKNLHPNLTNESILKQSSNIRVGGLNVSSVKIFGEEKLADDSDGFAASFYSQSNSFTTPPMFFEQTDYEIIVESLDKKSVSVWHENYTVRDRISSVRDTDDLISGIVNFGNSAGFSDFEISHDGKKVLVIRVEVFPSKISYKEDYQDMLQDISNEISGAVLDFMRNTYQEFSIGNTQNNVPAIFFEIIKRIFDKFQNAANTIISSPHHKLYVEHPVVPAHKVKKIDNTTIKWLQKHPEHVVAMTKGYSAVKAPTVKKQITYNTIENQFTKFILKTTMKKLKDFKDRYEQSTKNPEKKVINDVDSMIAVLNKTINNSFLREVDDYKATQSMSLVFEMAPGYRELYKYYLMLQRGLNINGDVFKMSLKDTAQLYEYWCFIKLISVLKKNYTLVSPDVIKVDNSGVTITLVKGKKSEVKFVNPRTGETIILAYNPGEQNTQTVNQKPDNVLTLEKRGSNVEYKYVFDAKYRIENNPANDFYPDNTPGPKVDDINTMHRYRDSIVYSDNAPSRFMFEKTMFGAYVLFPYDDPDGEYKNHRFYKSIDTVNIGGLPFLPGTTDMVESFLLELVEDSSESAFERASVPRGIEERLAKVDWSVKDVMVGTVRTQEQMQFNLENNCYYVPARFITEDMLPIKYIALYEEDIGSVSGIRFYGEVVTTQKVKRGGIPVTMRKNAEPDEEYYYYTVRKWNPMSQNIEIQDTWRGKPQFTNKFLLDNCSKSYQLFAISSEEEYRLMLEINKAFGELEVSSSNDDTAVYRVNDKHTIVTSDGNFSVLNSNGEILGRVSLKEFAKRPRIEFGRIRKMMG